MSTGSSSTDNCQNQDRSLSPKRLAKIPKLDHHASPYPVRKIALKFCYSGSEYSGLAFQEGPTPLPTVEGVLFNAMAQTFLVDRERGLEGCGWERCGRTDRGVSAAGQVVSVWVRTALEAKKKVDSYNGSEAREIEKLKEEEEENDSSTKEEVPSLLGELAFPDDLLPVDDSGDNLLLSIATPVPRPPELRYLSTINRVLPPTIRALAWSPVAPDFSARFACKYRHYKYFFSSHGLDVSLMQNAARRLVGEHDFRNLCKLDPAKQITNFRRRILSAEIGPAVVVAAAAAGVPECRTVGDFDESIYVLDLVGTAFLYHQVRHIMAILFLVGAGLEHPSVVSSLLNVDVDHPRMPQDGDPPLPIVDRKPEYQMADGLPLVLWECGYSDTDVQWRTDTDKDDNNENRLSTSSSADIYRQLHSTYTRSLIHSTLDAHFLAAAAQYHPPPPPPLLPPPTLSYQSSIPSSPTAFIPLGGGTFRRAPKYVPLLSRNRLESVEVVNERWRLGKGLRKKERQQLERDLTTGVGDGDESNGGTEQD